MTLQFTVREQDALVFTEQFLKNSPSHQKTRFRVRLLLPCILLALALFTGFSKGFTPSSVLTFGVISTLWYFYYPLRFDANIRNYAKKQMKESSYAKSLGNYTLHFSENGIQSASPLGSGIYAWSAVDRTELTDDYLFIFLAGPIGYAIRRAEIGIETSESAHQWILNHGEIARRRTN